MSFIKVVQKIKSEIILFKCLAKDTEGASGIEYAIIAGMVAVAFVVFEGPIAMRLPQCSPCSRNR